jgi:hypothetical protein
MLGAVSSVLPTLGIDDSNRLVVVLLVALTISYAVSAVRTTVDFHNVSRVPLYVAIPLAALSPIGIVILLRIGFAFSHGPEMSYLWHLLWRQ